MMRRITACQSPATRRPSPKRANGGQCTSGDLFLLSVCLSVCLPLSLLHTHTLLFSDGFPMLEIMGSNDAFLQCDKLVESLKPIARNLEVHVVKDGSHTPFVDAPDEVMSVILRFAKKVHAHQTW